MRASVAKTIRSGILGAIASSLCITMSQAQTANPPLSKTPPMGFNTWNEFQCNVSETLLKAVADTMAANGMKAAGYNYVNVDDCWEGARDANGFISSTNKFTSSSLKSLADYVHGKGMKFGAYTSLGDQTCQGKPATLGYESQDVRQWVNWGVDYIKVDWCHVNGTQSANPGAAYKVLGDTLKKYAGPSSARPILYSICNWGVGKSWTFGRSSGGQIWRTTPDIQPNWASIMSILDQQVDLYSYAGPGAASEPGGWNDPDMLEVGNIGSNKDENRAHFGMWCLLSAPLIAGNDVTKMTTDIRDILINKEVIAVDQDSLGVQAQRLSSSNQLEVWAKPMMGNCRAVGLLNRSGSAAMITVNWADLNKWTTVGTWSTTTSATVRDLWTKADVASDKSGSYGVSVPSHGLAILKLTPSDVSDITFKTSRFDIQGVNYASGLLNIGLPGKYSLQILDLNGRVLWRREGSGPSQYVSPVKGDGSHVLRLINPDTKSEIRF